ncbi:MAG: SagB/ThcOx family dehydrogenase [Spirochaetales bacterium]|nr:SagB/ThcOx family dehydrogenase [Spirochaetales bacterium]
MNGIGAEFMERTRYAHLTPSEQSRGLPQPPLERDLAGGRPLIELPPATALQLENPDLRLLLQRRRSLRHYAPTPLSLAELSFLLWSAQGVKKVVPGAATFRTVPSAGARHALETYLLVNRVETLQPGLYWYSALRHALLALQEAPGSEDAEASGTISDRVTEACLGQEFVKASAVTLLWAAETHRMSWRYGERGYRYLHLDAGHACQNLCLAAEAIGCGACAIAAFSDEAVNALLGLDGRARFAIYVAAVGKR